MKRKKRIRERLSPGSFWSPGREIMLCKPEERGLRMDFFDLYKLQSAVDSSVSGILVSEIPLITACVAIILVLGLSFSQTF